MTDAGVIEVVELDELLDFEPVCDWTGAGDASCDAAVEWEGVCECGCTTHLRCTRHRRSLDALMRQQGPRMHTVCGRVCSRVVWAPFVGGGSGG